MQILLNETEFLNEVLIKDIFNITSMTQFSTIHTVPNDFLESGILCI